MEKELNNKKILEESNIDLYEDRKNEFTRVIKKIYNEQKDLFENVYLPNILKKGLVKDNEKDIYDFVNQQLTIAILNELHELNKDTIDYHESILVEDRYEFLYELIDIIHFTMQGIFITSEFVKVFSKALSVDSIIEELLESFNTKEVKLESIDYNTEFTYYNNRMNSILSQLSDYYDWKHWKEPDTLIDTAKNSSLNEGYKNMLYMTLLTFLELEDIHLLERMYDIKNKVNRDRQKNGY